MTAAARPLDGIRVLELAQVVAGPFCGTLMAEFGAEVIKTEIPGKGDDLRRLGPSEEGHSYWFAVDNRNKKLMTLDLHQPKAQEIVRRLVPLRRRAGELPPGRARALGYPDYMTGLCPKGRNGRGCTRGAVLSTTVPSTRPFIPSTLGTFGCPSAAFTVIRPI